MPFDTTKLQQPSVTVLPPQPPERGGGGPQRIRIEIVDRRAPPRPRGYRFGSFTLALLVLILALAVFGCTVAHAQPSEWQTRQDGFMTRYEGADANGGQWTGNSYDQGSMRFYESSSTARRVR